MSLNRPDVRVFGQVRLGEPDGVVRLAATLPDDAASVDGHTLEIEFQGFYIDVEPFLELAAQLMRPGDSGHLDHFDDEHGVLTRYDLRPGAHEGKSHRYDDILEHTKNEGNR
ncbi:hypothetical protein [Fundidesulfovibrio agrisoli]|uniref:hypothetical protein n=1 Tax=Fundidesulfovibrio agrisoli TaxID=2922717 RepID=UPI001FABC68B|nr:hypothetical protein [Fundidesulfovibrio agrisoli]